MSQQISKTEVAIATAEPDTISPVVMTPVITVTETLLFKTNVNGRIKECSERGLELLELSTEDAEGRPLHQHFRPSDGSGG